MTISSYLSDKIYGVYSYFFPEGPDIMYQIPSFGSSDWKSHLGLDVTAPEVPKEISQYMDKACPFWPDKLVKETHFLCLVPSHLTLRQLYELTGARSNSPFLRRFNESAEKPYWILVTKKAIPKTSRLDFKTQEQIVSESRYKVPNLLEAAITVVCAKLRGVVVYPSAGEFTRCQEKEDGRSIAIGSDYSAPFSITTNDCNALNGVAGVYRYD